MNIKLATKQLKELIIIFQKIADNLDNLLDKLEKSIEMPFNIGIPIKQESDIPINGDNTLFPDKNTFCFKKSRTDQLIQVFKKYGALKRSELNEIMKFMDIPAGTVSGLLTKKEHFYQDKNKKWYLIITNN